MSDLVKRLEVARKQVEAGSLEAALEEYLAAWREGRSDLKQAVFEGLSEVGEKAEHKGRKELAAQAFRRAGEMQLFAGQPADALPLLARAHLLMPDEAALAGMYGKALFQLGQTAGVVELLEPMADHLDDRDVLLLAQAHIAQTTFSRAEGLLWRLQGRLPEADTHLLEVLEGYRHSSNGRPAGALLERIRKAMVAAGNETGFVAILGQFLQKERLPTEVLEFAADYYEESQQEASQARVLTWLFDRHVQSSEHPDALRILERLARLAPTDPENRRRLAALRGKVDEERFEELAEKIEDRPKPKPAPPPPPPAAKPAPETTAAEEYGSANILEDLMLQAEIFLQYGMKPRALERLERIARQFPGEDARNSKLHGLYSAAGFTPEAAAASARAAEEAADDAIVDITRVSDITRGIYRQATLKSVLSTAVNEIGRAWRLSRCVAGLCTPGKPPSAAIEYYAPGLTQSDVKSIVKLIITLVGAATDGKPVAVEDLASSSKFVALAGLAKTLDLKSFLALPLMENEQPIGVLILEQCGRTRRWRANDITVLKTLSEQIVITLSHVRLRSLMRTLSVADESSGLLARNSYLNCLLNECERARKQKAPLSVTLLQFGQNGSMVHEYGAEAVQHFIQDVAKALAGNLRQNDIPIQYEDDTLALVMPDTSGRDALLVCDKVRRVTVQLKMGDQPVPLAIGIAEALVQEGMDPVDSVTELINRAESALAGAQKEGASISKLIPVPPPPVLGAAPSEP